jgi:hypothetical protein
MRQNCEKYGRSRRDVLNTGTFVCKNVIVVTPVTLPEAQQHILFGYVAHNELRIVLGF